MKHFSRKLRNQPLWCSGSSKVPGSSPTELFIPTFFFFSFFCVVVFYKYIAK